MGHRQFGKSKKRPKTAHRRSEGRKGLGAMKKLPTTPEAMEADYTQPDILVLRRNQPSRLKIPAR